MPTKTTTLRIPVDCLVRWHKLAEQEHRNISSFVINACEQYCDNWRNVPWPAAKHIQVPGQIRVTPEEVKAILYGCPE
jgi:hypothetical protein